MMRPHKADAGDEASPAAKKRSLWLLAHRISAMVLLAASVYQCIDGAFLFAEFGGQEMFSTNNFIMCLAGGWCVCIVFIVTGRLLEAQGIVFNSGAGKWEKQVDEVEDEQE